MTAERITRDDIESKFRELQGEVDDVTDDVRSYAATVGAVLAVVVVLLAFFLGLRTGQAHADRRRDPALLMARPKRDGRPRSRRRRGG